MAEKVADIEAGPTPPQISAQSLPTLERRSFFSSLFRTSKTPESTTPKQRHDPAKLAARKVSPEVSRTGARRPSAAELGLAARNASADGSAPGMRYSYQSNSSGALPQRPNSGSRLTQSTNDMSTVDRGLSFNMSGLVRNSVMLFRGSTDPQQPTLTNMWQRYEARRTNAKAAAMVERTIQFLNLITTPRKLDMLNPHDWEAANRRAVEVGEETFYEEEEEEDTGDVPMPKSAIKYAQALLFFFQSKAGVGLSYMWGWGLVINRLGTYEDGSALWSAPSFFKVHQFSAGLTFGICDRSMCLALNDHESVELVMYGRPLIGWDINVVMDYLQAAYEGTVKYEKPLASRVTVDDNRVSAQYETVDGSMIDCSLKAGVALVSDDFHKRLYGAKLEPEDILFDPDLQPPEEFDDLYRHLEKLAAESAI